MRQGGKPVADCVGSAHHGGKAKRIQRVEQKVGIDLRLEQTDLRFSLVFLLLFNLNSHIFHDFYNVVIGFCHKTELILAVVRKVSIKIKF